MNLDSTQVMIWTKTGMFSREYELAAGGQPAARLVFRSHFGTQAEITFANESWTLKRSGLFRPRVTVRRAGSDVDEGTFTPKVLSAEGELVMSGGPSFAIARSGVFHDNWSLTGQAGELAHIKFTGMFEQQAEVSCTAALMEFQQPILLIAMVFYIALLHQMDAASAAAVIATS